jgi:hypothetical protein
MGRRAQRTARGAWDTEIYNWTDRPPFAFRAAFLCLSSAEVPGFPLPASVVQLPVAASKHPSNRCLTKPAEAATIRYDSRHTMEG